MTTIMPIVGLRFPNALALPALNRSPEGLAFGTIKDQFKFLLDPSYSEGSQAKNRARPDAFVASNGALAFGEINGRPAWAANSTGPRFDANLPMNPTAWSFLFVVQTPRAGATGGRDLIRGNNLASEISDVRPRVSIRTQGQLSIVGGVTSDIRVDGPAIPDDVPFFGLATFSVRDGCRIFINDELVGSNPADQRPLNNEYQANTYHIHRSTSAGLPLLIGHTAIIDMDLGAVEATPYRRAITDFMIDYYSIPT